MNSAYSDSRYGTALQDILHMNSGMTVVQSYREVAPHPERLREPRLKTKLSIHQIHAKLVT